MFCEKCGAEYLDGDQSCRICGAKPRGQSDITNPPNNENKSNESVVPKQSEQVIQGTSDQTGKNKKDFSKKKMLISGGVVVIVCLVLIKVFTAGNNIDLNEYLIINCYGYDSVGHATYEFDMEAFLEDYGEKIKYSDSSKTGIDWLDELADSLPAAEIMVSGCVEGSLSQTSNLSNGDVITFTWNCDVETADELYNCNLKYNDVEFTVSGLDKLETFDPFENVQLEYSGIAPNGKVTVQNNSTEEVVNSLEYTVTPAEGLSNGMTVKVSIDESGLNHMADTYGKIPSVTSREYIVEGLESYVTQLSQIPDDLMEKFKSQSEDVIAAYVAKNWSDYITLDNITFFGCYFLVPKSISDYFYTTQLYMVYELQVHEYEESRGLDNTFNDYYYVKFQNIMLLSDGTYSVDLSNYKSCDHTFVREVNWEGSWLGYNSLIYRGYESLDSLFNNCVTAQIDTYSYESTVKETNR